MKRTLILLPLLFLTGLVFAQKGKVTKASSLNEAGKLDEALETINLAINPDEVKSEKTISWPKTWEVRGDIFLSIYKTEDSHFKNLSKAPLDEALESYGEAINLDIEGKNSDNLKLKLTVLGANYNDQAFKAFKRMNYKKALYSFEQLLNINQLPIIKEDNPDAVDTITFFNAGLAAFNSEQYDKAIDYYKKTTAYGYNKGRSFVLLSSSYLALNDTVNAINILNTGHQKYPEDVDILTEMIPLLINTGEREKASKYLEEASRLDPGNSLIFNAYFNLGAFYYNHGIEQYEKAIEVPSDENERYKEELSKCDKWWDQALPLMKKCLELNKEDRATIETLKNLYYRMMPRNEDKYKALYEQMNQKLKNL